MPLSWACLMIRIERSSSTSPHQPVETVQTPKPTSATSMSVPPSLRYFMPHLSSEGYELPINAAHHSIVRRGRGRGSSLMGPDAERPVRLQYNARHERGDRLIARYAGGETGARAAAREGAAVVVVDTFRASTT